MPDTPLNRPSPAGTPARSARWVRPGIIALAILIAGSAGLAYRASHREPRTGGLVLAEVRRGDIDETVAALGTLQPRDYVDVGAQVSGQLKKLHVQIGDSVHAGDLLAEIDPQVLVARVEAGRAQVNNLKAQRREREAQLDLARRQLARQQDMRREDATSEDALQVAQAAVDTTAAQIDSLKAQLQQTESTLRGDEATLGYTKIYAPMDGTVVSLTARQGQTLNANQQAPVILRVADLSTMTVWTQVSEADVARLRIGMPCYFTVLGDPQTRWHGKLKQILPTPEVTNNVVLYTALFDVANPDGRLMTQMTAQVFFLVNTARNVPIVPMSALRARGAGDVYSATVVAPDGSRQDRDVRIGVHDRLNAQVRSGLSEGENVMAGVKPEAEPDNAPRPRFRGLL